MERGSVEKVKVEPTRLQNRRRAMRFLFSFAPFHNHILGNCCNPNGVPDNRREEICLVATGPVSLVFRFLNRRREGGLNNHKRLL